MSGAESGVRALALAGLVTGVVVGAAACGAGRAAPPEPGPARAVALTFDDLPFAGSRDPGVTRPATDALLGALARAGAPATGFVVGERLEGGPDGEVGEVGEDGEVGAVGEVGEVGEVGAPILNAWLDGGHALENHGHTHPHYNTTDIPAYLEDVRRGHGAVRAIVEPRGQRVGWFRAPFNEVGDTPEKRAALLNALAGLDARLAPFTAEHSDYLFDAVYTRALADRDADRAERVLDAYLAQLDSAMAFAEALSRDTFGREIPQILLLHANRINAAALPAMIQRLRARGYRFVSLDEAADDPAYATPNAYEGRWGISWLHRWRVGLGLPNRLRDEPGPPAWVMEAYEAL